MLTDLTLNLKVQGGNKAASEFGKVEGANKKAAGSSEQSWEKFAEVFSSKMDRVVRSASDAFRRISRNSGESAKRAAERAAAQAKAAQQKQLTIIKQGLDAREAARGKAKAAAEAAAAAVRAQEISNLKALLNQKHALRQAALDKQMRQESKLARTRAGKAGAAAAAGAQGVAAGFKSVKASVSAASEALSAVSSKAGAAFGVLQKGGELIGRGFSAIVGGAKMAAVGVAGLAASVGALAAHGASVASVRQSFEMLGGTASELEALKAATQGTVSEIKLMQSANLARGFDIDPAVFQKAIKFAVGSAKVTGETVDKMLGDTLTAISRGSAMIADNMGVQMTGLTEAYEAAAKKAGVTTDELTAKQKQNVFASVMFARGQRQMSLATSGQTNAAQTAAASLTNIKDRISEMTFSALQASGVVDGFSQILSDVENNTGSLGPIINMVADIVSEDLANGFDLAKEAVDALMPVAIPLFNLFRDLMPVFKRLGKGIIGIAKTFVDFARVAIQPLVSTLSGLIGFLSKVALALGQRGIAVSLIQAERALDTFNKGLKDGKEALNLNFKAAQKSTQSTKELGSAQKDLASQVDIATKAFDANEKKITEADKKYRKLIKTASSGTIDIESASTEFKKISLTTEEATRAVENFEQNFGYLGTTFRDAGADIGKTFLQQAGGDAARATRLTEDYIEAIQAARVELLNANAPDMGATDEEIAAWNKRWQKGRAQASADADKMRKDAARALRKPTKGGGRNTGAEELVYKASLIGLSDFKKSLMAVDKELSKNLETAKRNADAILAAQQIAFNAKRKLYVAEGVKIGADTAKAFARSFGEWVSSTEAAQNFDIINTALSKVLDFRKGETYRLGSIVGRTIINGFMDTISDELNFDTVLKDSRAFLTGTLPEAFEGVREAVAPAREEFEGFVSQFDGEATSVANENLLFLVSGIEDVTVSSMENFGLITTGLYDMGTAFSGFGGTAEQNVFALKKSFEAMGKATQGGVAIGKVAAGAFIKDKKKLAKVYGGFEVAEALRAAATGDFFGAGAHTIAAIKYFAVSGGGAGSASGGKEKRKSRQRTELGSRSALLDRRSGGSTVINQNYFSVLDSRPPGEMVIDAINQSTKARSNAQISGGAVSSGNVNAGGL